MTTIIPISTGTGANKGDGTSLRSAFHYVNINFQNLAETIDSYTPSTGTNVNLGHIFITDNIITSTLTNENIILDPNGTGAIVFRNSPIQFSWTGGGSAQSSTILNTRSNGTDVGLGIDDVNYSLRLIGDKDNLGTLVDMGLYTGTLGRWSSKFKIDYHGDVTGSGNITISGGLTSTELITALSGVRFPDGSTQETAVSQLTMSEITSGTISNVIHNIDTIRFDRNSGFQLTNLGDGAVEVGMNSTFKYWEVDGQNTLIAEGLDYVRFEAGNGVQITTDPNSAVKTISFSLTGGGQTTGTIDLGNLTVDQTTIYASTSSLGAALSNSDIVATTDGASYVSIPAIDDDAGSMTISAASPNDLRITTDRTNTAPITISPNVDGIGPGYVVIGSDSSTSTAGLFAFSNAASIDFWPNNSIANLNSGNDAGPLDLHTRTNNGNISIRPHGTGTTIVTSGLDVRKRVILKTSNPGPGNPDALMVDYQDVATRLNADAQIHKLSQDDYYLPPGVEGQVVYFVPTTTATNLVSVWMMQARAMTSGTTQVYTNYHWFPFSSNLTSQGSVFAIFTDNAWTTSHSETS